MLARILCLVFLLSLPLTALAQDRPNVILIMTDDQGIGDLGVMGNSVIDTPNIDRLAGESAWLNNFYVHPVCAPTRACLMTGRYNYRTRAIDTYIGRAMMEPDEVTIAELFQSSGYATGIFGKWHLGDCYPMRAIDQGFEQAVVHRGGGIGQPSDPMAAPRQYTNPVLIRNGVEESFQGYCTDIYYDEAMQFIRNSSQDRKPFFVYLPDNTPHGPFHDVPQDLYDHYLARKITRDMFDGKTGHPLNENQDADLLSRIFAMITNVDRNVGRLLAQLDELQLSDNTIVIFMCDNGPNSRRFVQGYRGHKSSVYEGGIRSPFFARWPGRFPNGHRVETVAAHIDLLPTLAGCCGVSIPDDVALDGTDLSPLLRGESTEAPDRNIVIQSHRGDTPTRYHHFAIRNQRWKMLHHSGFGREQFEGNPDFELYDLQADPFELEDVASLHPQVVLELKTAYDKWFDDVSSTRDKNFDPPRIVLDREHENPVVLTRQDWKRTSNRGWGDNGHWLIQADKPVQLTIECHLLKNKPAGEVTLMISGNPVASATTSNDGLLATFDNVVVSQGQHELAALARSADGVAGAFQIVIRILP